MSTTDTASAEQAAATELSRAKAELSAIREAASRGPIDPAHLYLADAAVTAATLRHDATLKAHTAAVEADHVAQSHGWLDQVHPALAPDLADVRRKADALAAAAADLNDATHRHSAHVARLLADLQANVDPAASNGRYVNGNGRVVVDGYPVRPVGPEVAITTLRAVADLVGLSTGHSALSDQLRNIGHLGNGLDTIRTPPTTELKAV